MTAAGMAGDLAPSAESQGEDFFDRVRRRLSLDVPAALHDPSAPAARGEERRWFDSAAFPHALLRPAAARCLVAVVAFLLRAGNRPIREVAETAPRSHVRRYS